MKGASQIFHFLFKLDLGMEVSAPRMLAQNILSTDCYYVAAWLECYLAKGEPRI